MKILIDLTFIVDGNLDIGFAQVASRLLDGFYESRDNDFGYILLVCNSSRHLFASSYPDIKSYVLDEKYVLNRQFTLLLKNYIYKDQIQNIIDEEKIDLFFSPFLHSKSIIVKGGIKSVGILHDVQKYHIHGKSILGYLYRKFMNKVLANFSTIVTISESAKQDILSTLPFLKSKEIFVIYNSIRLYAPQSISEIDKISPYILNVNTLMPYKNIITLIKAFSVLENKINHHLIIKALRNNYWDKEVKPLIEKLNLQKRIHLVDKKLNNREMSYLYSNASLFVSPSLMEGFGLTPVEAAIYQVPVVVSNIPTLKESTQNLVSYYNPPTDFHSLSKIMYALLVNNSDEKKHKHISQTLTNLYSLEKQVLQYKKIFEKCIQA